jgi:hypothetical protein
MIPCAGIFWQKKALNLADQEEVFSESCIGKRKLLDL